ncbi:MAG: hypothetical protein CBB92_05435 [Flammeovirgaceae bacterium TMED32]|nr:MAG: hypothetical protein CBB92_05435 [Flammeovirgaceae bacterium TMED32]
MRLKSKIMRQRWNNKCKCYFLDLMSDYKKKSTIYSHKEVAKLYVPNDEKKIMIVHKDNNPRNNRVENLLWMTASEHMR